uniref:Serpentine receptor class gamma n=1 Tax=Steinernema glaseri TaxID=37863 RepID=A0A1I7Z468_9BILA
MSPFSQLFHSTLTVSRGVYHRHYGMYIVFLLGGIFYLVTSTVCSPIYVRIIYLFLSRPSCKAESYRIMAQIGIVQMLVVPAIFTVAVAYLSPVDIWDYTLYPRQLFSAAMRVETPLNFVLALNRVKVICNLKYSTVVHNVLLGLIYLYGAVYLALLNSPWAGIIVNTWMARTDVSKPLSVLLSRVTLVVSMASMGACLAGYLLVIGFLLHKRASISKMKDFQVERTILIYALIHFGGDMFLVVGLYNISLPEESWAIVFLTSCFLVNYLILPPALYLTLYQNVRREFFMFRGDDAVPTQLTLETDLTSSGKDPRLSLSAP